VPLSRQPPTRHRPLRTSKPIGRQVNSHPSSIRSHLTTLRKCWTWWLTIRWFFFCFKCISFSIMNCKFLFLFNRVNRQSSDSRVNWSN
jgi:hypothetical protein